MRWDGRWDEMVDCELVDCEMVDCEMRWRDGEMVDIEMRSIISSINFILILECRGTCEL